MSSPTVYVIAGPTAVGKTAIAIALAKALGTDIISADSRQCYKEMSIGTAKPSVAELAEVKHLFIDEFPVTDALDAADYEQLAFKYLTDIFKTRANAVICGGTGLYIKAICEGIDDMPEVDEQVSLEVHEAYKQKGMDWLQEAVKEEDSQFYEGAEIENPARLMRALIFKRSTGQSILEFRSGTVKQRPFKTIKIGLELPREVLYERINKRVDDMMQQGLLNEVKSLYSSRHLKNLQTVGYSELFDHLDGNISLPDAIEKIKQHTRNYAKRQMTWFRKDEDVHWLVADDPNIIEKILAIK